MEISEILAKLVSFPVLGGESNLSIARWIEAYLEQYGVAYTRVPNEDGTKRSIHCRIGPAVDGGVILSGHMDVVPVAGQPWKTDPFQLVDGGDGKWYGRGSCDMKAFLACCLASLPAMLAAPLKRPIYFAFSYDEEIGCLAAPALAAHIKATYEERPQFAIIGEPTMMQAVVGQKGIVIYHTEVNGSAGHSSRVRTEVSAITEASRLVLWLEQKMNDLVAAGQLDDRFSPPHTSIHCGIFERSGIAPNIVADHADFYWDVRVIPKDQVTEIRDAFDRYCETIEATCQQRFPEFKITTTAHHPPVPPLDTPENLAVIDFIRSLCEEQKLDAVSYATEAGQFSEAGFEAVICGPGSIAQAHRANEFISKDQLAKGMKFMEKLIEKMST